jgi:uncharacterized membrane protein YeaQ/YmgE (transglycosylase-associated protein family)
MNLLYLIVIGAVAGYLATRIMQIKADPLKTIGIGIAGALIGGFILQVVLAIAGLLGGIIGAVLGAILLIWIYQTLTAGKK